MNHPRLLRVLGWLLVAAAIAGLIANIAGAVAVVVFERQARDGLIDGVDVLLESLVVTADGLRVADGTLARAGEAMATAQETLSDASIAVGDSLPALAALESTVGEDVPRMIESTRRAVLSAQASAAAVDTIQEKLSSIPLLGLERYGPDTPLAESLGDVAGSMEGMPRTVRSMRGGLGDAAENAEQLRHDLRRLSDDMSDVGASLEDARDVVADYEQVVAQLQDQAERARERLPVWLGRLRWAAWFVLAWLAIAQIALLTHGLALLTQGLELVARSRTGASS